MCTRFGPRYRTRGPTALELQEISDGYGDRGFPASDRCAEYMTTNNTTCPRADEGQYDNPMDRELAVLRCMAEVDGELYCWRWFVGSPGTNNDVTVLDDSPDFMHILAGRRQMLLPSEYALGAVTRHWLLVLLGDAAYPSWAVPYCPTAKPFNEKEAYAEQRQVNMRKDVEGFSECSQGRFHILRGKRREWSDQTIILIANVSFIVHKLIVRMRQSGELEKEAADDGGTHLVKDSYDDLPVEIGAPDWPAAAAGPVHLVAHAAVLERNQAFISERVHETLKTA